MTTTIARLRRPIEKWPFVPSDPAKRDERCRETFLIQATSLVRRMQQLPSRLRKIVLGVSGGQDSTHALLVAAHTMDLLGQPRADVIGITMPGFGTTSGSYHDACALIKAVGATFLEIPIRDLTNTMFKEIRFTPKGDGTKEDLVYENVQAWMRKMVSFSVACQRGGIDLGTGDLSELLIGWCTYGGDHMSHYNINGGVPKTLISFMIKWSRDVIFKDEPAVQVVLDSILNRPISPELQPVGANGEIVQKTENLVGPYELADFFGYHLVRYGQTIERIAVLALQAFEGKYTMVQIKHHLRQFVIRFFISQMKRDCMPDGPKVGLLALSPRGDWRMPADANPTLWVNAVDAIPNDVVLEA